MGMDLPYMCGVTVWCWADHLWPRGEFLGGVAISPFGVVSRDRRPLAPYRTISRLFRARQGLPPTPDPELGPTQVTMIRPDLASFPALPLPEGYSLRGMSQSDIALWTDIQRDAEPYITVTDSLFLEEFGHEPGAWAHRCFILRDSRGLGIGTISAWRERDFRGRDFGRVHWIAIRPREQSRGLGKTMLSFALAQLARWHTQAYLVTSTERRAAIKIYLDFGFFPDLVPQGARRVWEDLAEAWDHSPLRDALDQVEGPASMAP